MSSSVAHADETEEEEEWTDLERKGKEKEKKDQKSVDDDEDFTDESENEDPDGELERIMWIEKTKKEIAESTPHENAVWNCVICGKRCLGTSFIRFPENVELGSPSALAHVFDCAMSFRRQYDIVWEWERKIGEPKPGFDIDGCPIKNVNAKQQEKEEEKEK